MEIGVPGFLEMYPILPTLCTSLKPALYKGYRILSRFFHSKAVYNPLFFRSYRFIHMTLYTAGDRVFYPRKSHITRSFPEMLHADGNL